MRKGSRKSKVSSPVSNVLRPEQHGDKFSLLVSNAGKTATVYYSVMGKTAGMALEIDGYLYGIFQFQKSSLEHHRYPDNNDELMVLEEVTGHDGKTGKIVCGYLRAGKELILSRLNKISSYKDLDTLFLQLTELVNKTDHEIAENDLHHVLSNKFLHKVDLARLLDELWRFFHNLPKSTCLKLPSIVGAPATHFKSLPDLISWVNHVDDLEPRHGTFVLTKVDLYHIDDWRGKLQGTVVNLVIESESYIEKLQSSEENEKNGILIGDCIYALFYSKHDPIKNKSTYHITEVIDTFRGYAYKQQKLFNT